MTRGGGSAAILAAITRRRSRGELGGRGTTGSLAAERLSWDAVGISRDGRTPVIVAYAVSADHKRR
ncbi:hypothetical protein MINTM003_16780 [Mycobacterium paraintracellulare]|uniref:Uncharacterized protein n=1 Tax=Mycobacterium indicus pranii (strain DSM 45239 / MTCC 9506) TaxID=1232724 RepID=J9W915_MYCIP|nr:Hypothetical protein MIP_02428 [Mycobacterium intracellulare subsp. intracellulare MTCC 9506]BCO51237.1 hypothetical protein MINTM003_16780 [Mycobacterium paraintracellulare]BCO88423.1 hypothetical protein MINTM015_16800 [Mycobacterium paraintracellulare]